MSATPQDRPNILWLVSEDNSPQFVGPYGDPLARTPTIDRLARDGVVYDRAFSTAPVCAPSRFSIITGMYASSFAPAHQMRSRENDVWDGTIPSWLRGFPGYLRDHGYYCTNNAKEDYNAPVDVADAWDESSRAAHWRNRPDSAPFFAVFNYAATHESQIHPGAPEPLADGVRPEDVRLPAYLPDLPELRSDAAWYYDQNTRLDQQLALRLDELAEDGLADDTIIFFYGDHGGVLPRSKRFCYDSGLRVPLVVRVPEKWRSLWPDRSGSRAGELVTLMDLGPTALSLAGIRPPDYLHGRAIGGRFRTEPPAYAFGLRNRMDERYDFVRTVRDQRYRYVRNYLPQLPHGQYLDYLYRAAGMRAMDDAYRAGRLDGAPAAFFTERPFEELYDLDADPDEITNLADRAEYAEVIDRMRAALDRHLIDTVDQGFLPEGSPLQGRDDLSDPEVYPLQRVMTVAAQAARLDPEQLSELREWARDEHVLMRYWAVVGLGMLGDRAEPAVADLAERLRDPSPHVRIVAAEALCCNGDQGRLDDLDRAISVLEDLAVHHDHPKVRLQATGALDRIADDDHPAEATIEALKNDQSGYVGRLAAQLRKIS